jgi:hypothetical protein
MSTKQTQENYWFEQLAKAEQHPVSQMAYCREAGVEPRKLYAARERFKSQAKKMHKKKDGRMGFAPVQVVQSPEVKLSRQLPEAQWVADFVLHLMRGVR